MARTAPFDNFSADYEAWFEQHPEVYAAEVEAVRRLLPPFEKGIEIGVGSGRFSLPFGIREGIEPSEKMAEIARKKGIKTLYGVAEALPLADASYDLALMVTTICFVDDALQSLNEICRILQPDGYVIIGFVDRASKIGHAYERHRKESRFYGEATFYTAQEVRRLLEEAGFGDISCVQTIFGDSLQDADTSIREGYGAGAFVAMRAQKRD